MHTFGVVVPSVVSDPYSVLKIYKIMSNCLLFKGKEESNIFCNSKKKKGSFHNIIQLTSYYDKYIAKGFIGPEFSHTLQIQVYHKLVQSPRSSFLMLLFMHVI